MDHTVFQMVSAGVALCVALCAALGLYMRLTIRAALADWADKRDEKLDRLMGRYVEMAYCEPRCASIDHTVEQHDEQLKNHEKRLVQLEGHVG